MKSKPKKNGKAKNGLREQILQSMLSSFRIEGIHIPPDAAAAALRKVELNLGKQSG